MTAEDAYPLWLRKRIIEWCRALPADILPQNWEQSSRTLLKPVCQRCQRRLNTFFEIPAHDLLKAMLDGLVIDLTPSQQATIARWVIKTSMVLGICRMGLSHPNAEAVRIGLHSLLEKGTPPLGTTTRIAYLGQPPEPREEPFLPPEWQEIAPNGPFVFVSIVSVPGLVCETLATDPPVMLEFIKATQHDKRFISIWPPQVTNNVWPPAALLSLYDVSRLRAEWNHPPESVKGGFPLLLRYPAYEKPTEAS